MISHLGSVLLRLARKTGAALLCLLFSAMLPLVAGVQAAEVIAQNDSATDGSAATPCNCFIPAERVAAYLTAPVDGEIVGVQILWKSVLGGAPPSVEAAITISAAGAFPVPGAVMQSGGAVNAVIPGPTLIDGAFNEFRFLDPPTDTVSIAVPVSQGQQFVVDLELLNQTSGTGPFGPDVAWDADGCQSGKNAIFVVPSGWNDACLLGVTGDWVIRAIIDASPCGPAPEPGLSCKLAQGGVGVGKSSIQIVDKTSDVKDRIKWKWNKGETVIAADFKAPDVGTNGYRVCIYDAGGKLLEMSLPAGGSVELCDGKPCWKATGTKGFKYKNKGGSPHGITQAKFKEGPGGKSQIQIKAQGKGGFLSSSATASLTEPVVIQLLIDDGGLVGCFKTSFTAFSKKDSEQYKAKGP